MLTLADLPLHGIPVRLHLRVRRFFCDNPACVHRNFAERLPGVIAPYGRRTIGLATALECIAFACGGEGGARLASKLGMPASADTLLRLIRRADRVEVFTPRVLGVDDWALRRGQRYGTIFCDLEQHRPIDLLPERSGEVLSTWLGDHPGVEVVSRDRGDAYAKGARVGAPKAVQVADRWHLLHNLYETLVGTAGRYSKQVREAAQAVSIQQSKVQETSDLPTPMTIQGPRPPPVPTKTTRSEQLKQRHRQQRLARYEQVMALHRRGLPLRVIARQLGMHRRTVRRFVQAGSFPERAARESSSRVDPYEPYLRQRWDQGCHNAAKLTLELTSRSESVAPVGLKVWRRG